MKKKRKLLIGKGMKESQMEEEAVAIDKGRKKMFADVEMRRRKMEKLKGVYKKRENDQHEADQEKLKAEHAMNKDWTKDERSEARVGNWRDFGSGQAKKKQKLNPQKAGWKQESREKGTGEGLREEKRTSHLTDYRKSWK